MENRKNQPIKRPLKPAFGYILSSDGPHEPVTNLAPNYGNPNLVSPTPTDPGQRLHSPFGSNGPSPSHSPISVDLSVPHKRIPPQTCRKIDSYYRKTNENYLKSVPKTERQKSKIKRIAQLDDAIFELEQMYKKLKLSDQDLLDRAERRDLPTKFQLMRFSSASQMPPVSPTPVATRSDEEPPRSKGLNQSTNELNKRRPISAFYNQFQFQQQKTPPVRRSGVPDLIADDQAVRRLNSPLPPRTPTSSFQALQQNTPIAPAYLDTTAAYANPLQMQHSKKKNIYGHLEFDPIVDDVQYRKLSQHQSSIPAPHPPIGTPLNAHQIKPNPTNDYLHSLKSNDMAVRSLRKDKDYSVNQTNPFAKVLHHSSQSFYNDDDLLPETTANYLVNIKKKLKPTRSMTMMAHLGEDNQMNAGQYAGQPTSLRQMNSSLGNLSNLNREMNREMRREERAGHQAPVQLRRPFTKSSSLSNCLLSQQADGRHADGRQVDGRQADGRHADGRQADGQQPVLEMAQVQPQKPKNNIYRKPSSTVPLRNEEEQLEDLLSNLNQIPKIKSPDVIPANRFGIISRPASREHREPERPQDDQVANKEPELTRLELQQASLTKMMPSHEPSERTFGLIKSPTEFINQPVRPQRVLKSRTQGSLSNEREQRPRFVSNKFAELERLERNEANRRDRGDRSQQNQRELNRNDQNRNDQNRDDLNRNDQIRSDQIRNDKNRSEQIRNDQNRNEQNRSDSREPRDDQRSGRLDKREEVELLKLEQERQEQEARSSSPKSIWPSQIKKQQKQQKEQKLKSDSHLDWPATLQTNSQPSSARAAHSQVSSQASSQPTVVSSASATQIAHSSQPAASQPATSHSNRTNRNKRSLIFTRSASVDQPSQNAGPAVVPYCLPERSRSQVNKMKNLFEAKLEEHLHGHSPSRFESRIHRASTKKSSTQPDLMNYDYRSGDSDKKQKKPSKLRKLKSAHSLLNRSLQLFGRSSKPSHQKPNTSDDYDHLQFTDESEHETSESDSSSLSSRQEF